VSPHLSFSSSPYRSSPFISPSPYFFISLFPHFDFSLPPVSRQLPDQTLSSKLAVEFWIKALTAMVYVETLAALPTEAGFMFLTEGNGLSIRVDSALHLTLLYHLGRLFLCLTFNRFETGRCLRSR